ncbi:Highly reducing polyketide synthase alt5 [Cladobotryum mycophilum]|uniref:Highly reducing polyketide synthase alt5 n=1 Tax=Cladobotryum mycophilum TaxID=491253 RepID=A0ABR0T5G1_9HYPO
MTDKDGAKELVEEALVKRLARLMMVAPEDVEISKSLSSHGIDSLIAVEVRNWIATEVGVEMSVFDILDNISIGQMARSLVEKLLAKRDGVMDGVNGVH